MIAFPFAKVNIGLRVLRMRPDGYRDIESVLLPIPLRDVLEVVRDENLPGNGVLMAHSGHAVPGDPGQDLCIKAIRAVQHHRDLPGLRIHLHKVIPAGAGLGGGSSDATHTLLLCDQLLGLRLSHQEMHELAASLGSDCPFFLDSYPKLVSGRGEIMRAIHLPLEGKWMVLVAPGVHVGTTEVYANTVAIERPWVGYEKVLNEAGPIWQDLVVNDMETYVLSKHPEIGRVKERLIAAGAWFASMSGSGSSVFGLFDAEPPAINWPETHQVWSFQI